MRARGIRRVPVLRIRLLFLVCLHPGLLWRGGSDEMGKMREGGLWNLTDTNAGSGFTLTSSKGPCDIIAGEFSCAVGNTAGVFTVSLPLLLLFKFNHPDSCNMKLTDDIFCRVSMVNWRMVRVMLSMRLLYLSGLCSRKYSRL